MRAYFLQWVVISDIIFYLIMQESIHTVWLDCDPGLDDTLAIILAAKHSGVQLLGVSTSAGNTSIENTTKNALDILFNVGRSDVVVVRGSDKLVAGEIHLAQHMHGAGGLGGIVIPPSDKNPITQNSFKAIRDYIIESPHKVTWANTGALTNLCFLFRQFPQVKGNIQKIVIMGGAIGKGNITPAAQFNVYFDPVAYKEILQKKQKIPLVMIPLEVTHEVQARQHIFGFLEKKKEIPILLAIYNMLKSYQTMYKNSAQHFDYPPIHDPTVINYILHPQNFDVKKAIIDVDVGKCSFGRTNCYFSDAKNSSQEPNSMDIVATKMRKRKNFWAMFQRIFEHLSQDAGQK